MIKNILLITDGKPGHENISRGIIETIRKYKDINLIEVNAKLRSSLFKRLIKNILNKSNIWQGRKLFIDIFYKGCIVPQKIDYDLVISTGGATSFLNIMLSKYLNCPNIYCSSLRGLDYTFFTHIISLEDHHYNNVITVDVAPLVLDTDPAKVEVFKRENAIDETENIWSVLVGGPTKDYPFSVDDIEKMISGIIKLAKKNKAKLCVTTSRRTTREMEKKLYDIFKLEKSIIKKYVLYNQKPEKVMGMFLAVADRIFVTEESGSMITEAILSKKTVYTIRTNNANPRGIYNMFMDKLMRNKIVISVEIEDISLVTLDEAVSCLKQSPAEKVYDKIKYLLED